MSKLTVVSTDKLVKDVIRCLKDVAACQDARNDAILQKIKSVKETLKTDKESFCEHFCEQNGIYEL